MSDRFVPLRSPRALAGAGWLAAAALLCGPTSAAPAPGEEPLLTINGVVVPRSEIDQAAAPKMRQVELEKLQCEAQVEQHRHQVLQATVEEVLRGKLVLEAARKAGQAPAEWQAAEQARREAAITDEQVDTWFNQNKARIGNRATKEQIAPQIKTALAQQGMFEELRTAANVQVKLEPFRVQVPAIGPAKGAADAKVTLVEFSDFECPFCQRIVPTLDRVVTEYGDRVRLVFRQYPLDAIHAHARKAAEASLCADEQGKFWAFHDLMFAEQKALADSDLKDKAQRLGLDGEAFAACLDSGRHAGRVEEDVSAGALAGVTGTPALYVNGRPMSGAVPFEDIAEIIEDELERSGAKPAP